MVDPEGDLWMDASINTKIGGGIFGEVFGGSIGSEPIALKVARDQVRLDRLMMNNFRRGVASMKLLSDSKFAGVPKDHRRLRTAALYNDGFRQRKEFGSSNI